MLIALATASGCASNYEYVPAEHATATVQGRTAAYYPIPPQSPQGDVRIASFGFADVKRQDSDEKYRAIHLRLVISDNSNAQWTFDTRNQRIELNGNAIAPAFASADPHGAAPPAVNVPAGGKRTVDLFFLLPPGLQHADEVPEFDALWRVQTQQGVVAERTPFERLLIEPDYYASWWDFDYGPGYYWGGPYWANPAFPYAGYPYGGFGPTVIIRRGPHFMYGGGYHGHYHGHHH